MTIAIKPTASGSTIEQNGSTILTVDGSGNIDVANNLTTGGSTAISNTPIFNVTMGSSQTMSDSVSTKLVFNTKSIDTNSAFDAVTNYRFTVPSGFAGKYFLISSCRIGSATASDYVAGSIEIYKNGSSTGGMFYSSQNNYTRSGPVTYQGIFDASVGDYFEVYAYIDTASGTPTAFSGNIFSGYRLIG